MSHWDAFMTACDDQAARFDEAREDLLLLAKEYGRPETRTYAAPESVEHRLLGAALNYAAAHAAVLGLGYRR